MAAQCSTARAGARVGLAALSAQCNRAVRSKQAQLCSSQAPAPASRTRGQVLQLVRDQHPRGLRRSGTQGARAGRESQQATTDRQADRHGVGRRAPAAEHGPRAQARLPTRPRSARASASTEQGRAAAAPTLPSRPRMQRSNRWRPTCASTADSGSSSRYTSAGGSPRRGGRGGTQVEHASGGGRGRSPARRPQHSSPPPPPRLHPGAPAAA